MIEIERQLYSRLKNQLYKGKTILIFGARRVGKTHLLKKILEEEKGLYLNGELSQVRAQLSVANTAALQNLIGDQKLVLLDEIQTIPGIGLTLKVLHDHFPDVQFVATGSSALELRDATAEPLTGRTRTYNLFPLSYHEIKESIGQVEAYGQIENLLRFGAYPEVFQQSETESREELENIAFNYLYKDALQYGNLKRPDLIQSLLRLLAFQIGQEVSLNELANKTNTNVHTIQRYLSILEQSYVIVSLGSLSRNLRNEIGRGRKYYFIDLGIRNALINNFNPLPLRDDIGPLWENFCVIERMKRNEYDRRFVLSYFWRTYEQKEIDYIEEKDGQFAAYEFNWNNLKSKPPAEFMKAYPESTYSVITRNTFFEFI